MSAFKRLKESDVVTLPIVANKNWKFNFTGVYGANPDTSSGLVVYTGQNMTGSFNPSTDPLTYNQYSRLVYDMINHNYYQLYSDLLNTQSLASGLYYESASQYRPTGSYFNYNSNPNMVKNFPTGANELIRIFDIKQSIYGNKINPGTFILSASSYYIVDDTYGNLIDIFNSSSYIGNIFYEQGLAIITSQDYKWIVPIPPIATNIYYRFLNVDTDKIISSSLAGCYTNMSSSIDPSSFTLISSSLHLFPEYTILSGSNDNIFINNDDILGNTPGTYQLLFTVKDTLGLPSNTASITMDIYSLPLIVGMSSSPTQSYFPNELLLCNPTSSIDTLITINYGIPDYEIFVKKNNNLIYHNFTDDFGAGTIYLDLGQLTTGSYLATVVDASNTPTNFPFSITPKIDFDTNITYNDSPLSSSVLIYNIVNRSGTGSGLYNYNIYSGSISLTGSIPSSSVPNILVFVPNPIINQLWNIRVTESGSGCYNEYTEIIRGRYFTYSGSFCQRNPNIEWDVAYPNTSSAASTFELYVNNVFITSSVAAGFGASTEGSWEVNMGDNVTFVFIQSGSQAFYQVYEQSTNSTIAFDTIGSSSTYATYSYNTTILDPNLLYGLSIIN